MKTINDVVRGSSVALTQCENAQAHAAMKLIARKQLRAKERMALIHIDAMAELRDHRQDQAVKPPKLHLVRKSARVSSVCGVQFEAAMTEDREVIVVGGRAIASVSRQHLKAA